jgi:hypothetical protein
MKQEKLEIGLKNNKENILNFYRFRKNIWDRVVNASILYLIIRNKRVFKQMSKFIGTRDGIQCRSHHIKQLKVHKQINKIIQ